MFELNKQQHYREKNLKKMNKNFKIFLRKKNQQQPQNTSCSLTGLTLFAVSVIVIVKLTILYNYINAV